MRLQYVTDALLTMLQAQTDNADNPLRIGDAKAPEPADGAASPKLPYAVVSSHGGDLSGPPLSDQLWSDACAEYQIRSVSWSRRGANWMADRIRFSIMGRGGGQFVNAITPTGYQVIGREGRSGSARIEGTVWVITDIFYLWVTPA